MSDITVFGNESYFNENVTFYKRISVYGDLLDASGNPITGSGAQGIQGITGVQGATGTQGAQGIQGINGAFVAQGIQGVQGTTGSQGVTGSQGTQGTQGVQGTQGIQGINGAFVAQGIQGIQGMQGTQGTLGTQGTQGIQGTFGPATIPQNSQTTAYILAASDVGKHISITTGGVTVNSGIFSAGDAISIYNNSGSNQTITQGTSVTMYLAGTATTGNRTLAQRGVCSILCVASDTFAIFGAGLT